MTSRSRYDRVAQTLHWVMAVVLGANLALGWYAESLGRSRRQLELFLWHKSLGITLLALVMLRLGWRWWRGAPAPVPMPRWQLQASRASHALLYLLMVLVPLAGWLLNSAANVPLNWFGLFRVPDLIEASKPARAWLELAHYWLAWSLAALVVIHLLAALKHALIDRDDVVARMWRGEIEP
ncbi:MAG: cytochrome b [Pseudomonadota bacterium]